MNKSILERKKFDEKSDFKNIPLFGTLFTDIKSKVFSILTGREGKFTNPDNSNLENSFLGGKTSVYLDENVDISLINNDSLNYSSYDFGNIIINSDSSSETDNKGNNNMKKAKGGKRNSFFDRFKRKKINKKEIEEKLKQDVNEIISKLENGDSNLIIDLVNSFRNGKKTVSRNIELFEALVKELQNKDNINKVSVTLNGVIDEIKNEIKKFEEKLGQIDDLRKKLQIKENDFSDTENMINYHDKILIITEIEEIKEQIKKYDYEKNTLKSFEQTRTIFGLLTNSSLDTDAKITQLQYYLKYNS